MLVANKYKYLFKVNGCYENVFKLLTKVPDIQPSTDLKILFCYVPDEEDCLYYRHAFCLYKGQIVEPLLHLNISAKDLNAIVLIRLLEIDEYYRLLLEDGRYDLWCALSFDGIQAYRNSKINLNPFDSSNLHFHRQKQTLTRSG